MSEDTCMQVKLKNNAVAYAHSSYYKFITKRKLQDGIHGKTSNASDGRLNQSTTIIWTPRQTNYTTFT